MTTELTFTTWAQYTRDARTYIPTSLGYGDEAPWSQSVLASLMGVDSNYISMIERADKEPGRQFQLTLNYIIQMARNGLDPRNI